MKNSRSVMRVILIMLAMICCVACFIIYTAGEENVITVTFDLHYGNVSITDTGYVGVNSNNEVISGTEEEGYTYKYLITQTNPQTATNYVVSICNYDANGVATGVEGDYEVHFNNVNIDAPKTAGAAAGVVTTENVKTKKNHAPAVYVYNDLGSTVYLVMDDNTQNNMTAYAQIFPTGSTWGGSDKQLNNSTLLGESNRFGHAAIEKEVDSIAEVITPTTEEGAYPGNSNPAAQGTLVVTCEEGLRNYQKHSDYTEKGHTCEATDSCGVLNATAVGQAGFKNSKSSNTRTAAAAAIGSKAEVSSGGDGEEELTKNTQTRGTLHNLIIAGGKITATGATGNWNNNSSVGGRVFLGGSPGIGVGAGMQQYSIGYAMNNLRITGGLINSIAGDGSAANIGGGYHAGYVWIYIYGGNITATEKRTNTPTSLKEIPTTSLNHIKNNVLDMKRGPGIGGGAGGATSNATAGAYIEIHGGTIGAYSEYGAAIGSGGGGTSGDAHPATIKISDGTVTATTNLGNGNGAGAAIGGGGSLGTGKGGAATVTISGGTITASSQGGADIGGGGTNSTSTSGSGGTATVTITGGDITALTGGIGGGKANKGTGGEAILIDIRGGTINASSIGGGSSKGTKAGGGATVTVNGKDASIILQDSIGGGNCDGTGAGGTANVTVHSGYLQCGDIGGGNSVGGNGGSATVVVTGGTLIAKSIGGGSTQSATKAIGYASATISDGVITGQFIMAAGGTDACTFTMTGGRLFGVDATSGDYTKYDGGAIYMDDPSGVVNISGGTIEDCKAQKGGAIYMTAGTATISGTAVIQNCSATAEGGAIYMGGGSLAMSGGKLYSNDAVNGAGAYLANGTMTVSGGIIDDNTATENGGAAYLGGGTLNVSGGIISNNDAKNGAGAYLASNSTMNVSAAADIQKNIATQDGGGAYLAGGNLNVSGGRFFQNQAQNGAGAYLASGKMIVSGGSISENQAALDGGGAYLAGGTLNVSGGSFFQNQAQNGAAALVANGNVNVSGGTVSENVAQEYGGAFSITNGNYTMTGGTLSNNHAVHKDGGAIYVSSSQNNTNIIIRSGTVTGNFAGNSGGAIGVYGQDNVHFTITIGSNTSHVDKVNCHVCADDASVDENCPIITKNVAATSAGGVYLSGSYDAVMNMHCLVESGNKAGDGVSKSNFMMVDGGTLNISTNDANGEEDCGSIEINSSIHVTDGKVFLSGDNSNLVFKEPVTVEVDTGKEATFLDQRESGETRTIQYFENFEVQGQTSGRYQLIDVDSSEIHYVRQNVYSVPGYAVVGWELMKIVDKQVVPTGKVYPAGEKVTETGNLIFYAKWEVHGYKVEFVAGVDSYKGTMAVQGFTYTEEKALSENKFIRVGFKFSHWYDEADPTKTYLNCQVVSELTETHGKTITLVAEWIECNHSDMSDYTLTKTSNSYKRECSCLGYSETATLPSVSVVFDGNHHGTEPIYNRVSLNNYTPAEIWNFTVYYDGSSNAGDVFDHATTAPHRAGTYTASISLPEAEAVVVNVIIRKADQEAPEIPTFDETTDVNGDKTITISNDFVSGLEYRFTYYNEKTGETVGENTWIPWTDEHAPPSMVLEEIYTKYYVDVRFAATDDYNASIIVRGRFAFSIGQISFVIVPEKGLTVEDESIDNQSMSVNVVPASQDYYVYDLRATLDDVSFAGYFNYRTTQTDGVWQLIIDHIQNPNTSVQVTINLSGAMATVSISTSVLPNEVFTDMANVESMATTISRDSAYTVYFKVMNFLNYQAPSIAFDTAIPAGSTVIMKDYSDSSYWCYTATENVTSIPLTAFVRMGSVQDDAFDVDGKISFVLQLAVDFSGCENAPEAGTLIVTKFTATPTAQDIPNMPSTGSAITTVTLVEAPTFDIGEAESPTDSNLSQSLSYEFALPSQENVGMSKWNGIGGILIVEPTQIANLPADARLQVKIGENTDIYYLINGKFTVALPASGEGTASLTLLSDMLPNEDLQLTFSVSLCASATGLKSTPDTVVTNATVTVTYSVSEVVIPAMDVELIGNLPSYNGSTVSSLSFEGLIEGELPQHSKIKASLYIKNDEDESESEYIFTTQVLNDDKLVWNGNSFTGTMLLNSFADDMYQNKKSLSMMLKVELLDANGKTVTSVPVYFILIDERQ